MRHTRKPGGRGDDAGQLQIEWFAPPIGGVGVGTSPLPAPVPPLVQRLPWDFVTTFPQPTPEAIDAGIVSDEDNTPDNIRAIHEEHAREALTVLRDLDVVMDARRRGVDPRNNKAPLQQPAKERLRKFFETEPGRLERWFQNLIGVYQDAFGPDAADAFAKALRARHAGIVVASEPSHAGVSEPAASPKSPPALFVDRESVRRKRISTKLPVPRPLPCAVAARHFGQHESGAPVRPVPYEVREITQQHADKLVELLDAIASAPATGKDAMQVQFAAGIAAYGEDFGQQAADQLEAYVRRQAGLDSGSRRGR
jgi:hypothetical protein